MNDTIEASEPSIDVANQANHLVPARDVHDVHHHLDAQSLDRLDRADALDDGARGTSVNPSHLSRAGSGEAEVSTRRAPSLAIRCASVNPTRPSPPVIR